MKKITVRKAGSVRLTSAATPMYAFAALAGNGGCCGTVVL